MLGSESFFFTFQIDRYSGTGFSRSWSECLLRHRSYKQTNRGSRFYCFKEGRDLTDVTFLLLVLLAEEKNTYTRDSISIA